MELLQHFPQAKVFMTDNEPSFTSAQFKSFAQPRLIISNEQVERAHWTLTELARCIKKERTDYSEIVTRAAQEYNQSIHSTTNQKSYDIYYNKIEHESIPQILKKNLKKKARNT